jgi:hypothetical protein
MSKPQKKPESGSHIPQPGAQPPGVRVRTEKRNRREYLAERRRQIREKALRAVSDYNQRPVECFRCGKTNGILELDHIWYSRDSVRYGHSGERAEEAIKFPSRFYLLCRACHISKDLKDKLGPNGFHPRAEYGSEVRALEAGKARKAKQDQKTARVLAPVFADRDEAVKRAEQAEARVKILEEEKAALLRKDNDHEKEIASLILRLKKPKPKNKKPREMVVKHFEPDPAYVPPETKRRWWPF